MESRIKKIENFDYLFRSQITINSLKDVLRELVQNSVDARSTLITITITHSSSGTNVRVQDNGCGMTPDELEIVGERFVTSKLGNGECLNELKNVKSFGFRGEAINSILKISSTCSVVAKALEYNSCFRSVFVGEKRKGGISRLNPNSVGLNESSGVVFNAVDLFDTIPVRKKQLQNLSWASILADLRKVLFESLINEPRVTVNVYRAEENNRPEKQMVMNIVGASKEESSDFMRSKVSLLRSLYGKSTIEEYEKFDANFKEYKVKVVIGLNPKQSKSQQYVFLNNRPLLNEELMKEINKRFHKQNFGFNHINSKENSPSKIWGRPFSTNPVFIFMVESSCNEVSDLLQDPTKSCFSSKHLEIITPMLLKIVDLFFSMTVNPLSKQQQREPLESPTKKKPKSLVNIKESIALRSSTLISKISDRELKGRVNIITNENNESNEKGLIDFEMFRSLRKRPKLSEWSLPNIYASHNCQVVNQNELAFKSPFFVNKFNIELKSLDLDTCKVIKQIDDKFILIRLNCSTNSGLPMLLVIDQHACDERIKVEQLFKETIESTVLSNDHSNIQLKKYLILQLSVEEYELMIKFENQLSKWGIKFQVEKKELDDAKNIVMITHLPEFISERIKGDVYLLLNGIREFLNDLETKKKIQHNGSMSEEHDWWNFLSQMPEIYKEIIKSKACRTSVMFGDKLGIETCKEMIKKLACCKDPFKCAHGRPSIVPLVNLLEIQQES